MAEEETDEIDEVLEETAEKQVSEDPAEDKVDEFLEENYDELEAALDYKANELDIKKNSSDNSEKKSSPDFDESEKDKKQNYIKQMKIKDELDKIIGDQHSHDPHEGHAKYAVMLGGALISVGFLYDSWFLTLYLLGLVYGTIEISRRLPGSKNSKFATLVKNHFRPYLMSGITFFVIFIGKMNVPKLEGGLGLLAKILIGI